MGKSRNGPWWIHDRGGTGFWSFHRKGKGLSRETAALWPVRRSHPACPLSQQVELPTEKGLGTLSPGQAPPGGERPAHVCETTPLSPREAVSFHSGLVGVTGVLQSQ